MCTVTTRSTDGTEIETNAAATLESDRLPGAEEGSR